jgi:hypothetical protein
MRNDRQAKEENIHGKITRMVMPSKEETNEVEQLSNRYMIENFQLAGEWNEDNQFSKSTYQIQQLFDGFGY